MSHWWLSGVNFLTYIVYIHTCKSIHWYITNIFWPKNERWELVFSCHCKCHLSFKIFTCHNVRHYRSCAKACLHTLKKDTIVILKSYRKIRSIFFVELNFLELFAISCSCESPMSAGSVGSINNSNINVKYDYSIFDFIKYQ